MKQDQQKTEQLLKQKYQAKERAAQNGDFKTFSLISQDIREIEYNLKQVKQQ